jgi:ribonuclease HI
MMVISIDGACRRNGKPDCVAAGGVFCLDIDDTHLLQPQVPGSMVHTTPKYQSNKLSGFERNSTNQRGEMIALKLALQYICDNCDDEAQIITDSEYLFNAMTKDWCVSWKKKGWKTATGGTVKNQDLWEEIQDLVDTIACHDIEVTFYHIKGHCISIGPVTAADALRQDTTGETLRRLVMNQYKETCNNPKQVILLKEAQELSVKNNGFQLEPNILRRFVVLNLVADRVATECVEATELL